MMQWIFPSGLFGLVVIGLITVHTRLAKRPSWKETEDRYRKIESCKLLHQNINEKLNCLPEIKEDLMKIKIALKIRD